MAKAKNAPNKKQPNELLALAREVILSFARGLVSKDDPNRYDLEHKNGVTFFENYVVRYTDQYLKFTREFTKLAARKLNAQSVHESTIREMCRHAGQDYLKSAFSIDEAAASLVKTVLAEAGRQYVLLQPNHLIRHSEPAILSLGRVRSMPTELAGLNTALSKFQHVKLRVGTDQKTDHLIGMTTVSMPPSIWVVEVAATKENVQEEAKWLIDVAISLMRLSTQEWKGHFPGVGEIESHPTRSMKTMESLVTIEGDSVSIGGYKLPTWYESDADIVAALNAPEVQQRALILLDPSDKVLAQSVAQGLGWMTRGRQAVDRAERLLCFFTSIESLLTSNQKNDPVTQTISRHPSIIYSQNLNVRMKVYNQIKLLYALRSSTIHTGRREVLWNDVNSLQVYVETVFWIVLNRCDLNMTQERFAQSLSAASHGERWEFAVPISQPQQ